MFNPSFLNRLVEIYQNYLLENPVGVYLHGSLAMGCYHPEYSDIDILVVVRDKISRATKKRLIQEILRLEQEYPEHKLEMSILLNKYLIDFHYPTPFELHYSDLYKPTYQNHPNFLCEGDVDPDLAAHCVVTKHRGITLFGKDNLEVFPDINPGYYIQSILNDIEDAPKNITKNPIYFSLNLCRVLYYLKKGVIASKKEGGEWAVSKIPDTYTELINIALDHYAGKNERTDWDHSQLIEFAEFMLKEINQELNTEHIKQPDSCLGGKNIEEILRS
ncbi:streptomycin 3-adenylyltransferase [Salinibacillus kushneri]|uniref:Spectinomycin 9-adenylyltransferase n=2 Tax=Salinibacillus kushneri TaxID=237682 RepID=A0A1I0F646_9BACI|nr:streptomycin 3-adenylyltransferase [Salinibacillus kushneri]